MKHTALTLSLLALGAAGLAAPAAAIEAETSRKEVIVIAGEADADVELVDIADLEVGESRSASTESGKAVIVTRLEDGYDVEVDGETTSVRIPDVAGLPGAAEGAALTKVFVEKRRADGDEAGAVAYVLTDALDDEQLRARIAEIMSVHHGHGEGDVIVAPGASKRVKVVRVIEDDTAEGEDGEAKEKKQHRVIVLREHAPPADQE